MYPGNRRNSQRQQPHQSYRGQTFARQSSGPPPPLSDPHRWFDYFDRDRGGSLDQEEVVAGLMQTHPNLDAQKVREQVHAVWPAFDTDGSGKVDRGEFCHPGGMGEALLAATARRSQPPPQQARPAAYVPQAQPAPYVPQEQAAPQPFVPSAHGGHSSAAPPAQNPSYDSSEEGDAGFWTCGRCTFINATGDPSCKACHGPAPPVSAAPTPISHQNHAQPFRPAQSIRMQQHHSRPSQTQHQEFQTIRVNVPPGMRPGQQIRVKTGSESEPALVTIPGREQWRNLSGGQGSAFFEMEIPKSVAVAAPVVVQGSHIDPSKSGVPAGNYSGVPTQSFSQPWQSWENFRGHAYEPVPLGMQRPPPNEVFPRTSTSNVPASGRRKALLIGINYRGTRAELRGCVNDALNMKELLMQHGFRDDSTHMVMLLDENTGSDKLPTNSNILKGMQWLVQGASPGDVLFFHFSGHGAQMPDKSGHEADGFNETILPVDYKSSGQISDDVIWGSIVWPLPSGCRLTALMDCCHSGTGLDLPFEYNLNMRRWVEEENPAHSKGDVVQFSGCEDSQTSADADGDPFSKYQAGGAMTQSFIRAFKENPHSRYPQFMEAVHRNLRRKGFPQRPALTASQSFDFNSRVFSLTEGIEPNHNHEIGRIKRRHVKAGKSSGGGHGAMEQLFEGLHAFSLAGGGKKGMLAVGKKIMKNF